MKLVLNLDIGLDRCSVSLFFLFERLDNKLLNSQRLLAAIVLQ